MTNAFLYAWTFVLGLCLGSFFNVVVLRDTERMSILTGRSRCPRCKHRLQALDLLPLLSFAGLLGRCRYCKQPISWQYPLVELVSGLLLVLATWLGYVQQGSLLLSFGLATAFLLFLAAALVDLRTFELPVEYCLLAAIVGGFSMLLANQLSFPQIAGGVLLGWGSLALVYYAWKLAFRQEGMGTGDLWLAGCLGAVLGYPRVGVALLLAVFAGALVGLAALALGRKKLQSALPFGPFLVGGFLVALVWGTSVLHWYFGQWW